jgi:hypothetical protein
MKLFTNILIIAALLYCSASAQISSQHPTINSRVYEVPFASSGNQIELTVANASTSTVSAVEVKPVNVPAWIQISPQKQIMEQIEKNGEVQSQFIFSLDKTAPVGKDQTIIFNIKSGNGESWTKQITIKINAPEKYELFQNYPNPFNPSTNMSFVISQLSFVSLKVYNVLGQEVATLVDGEKSAGYHEVEWNGSDVSSGVYFYKLEAAGMSDNSKSFVQIKKMLLAK